MFLSPKRLLDCLLVFVVPPFDQHYQLNHPSPDSLLEGWKFSNFLSRNTSNLARKPDQEACAETHVLPGGNTVRTHLLVGCLRTFPIPLKFPDFTEKKRVLTSNVMQHHVMMPNYHKYINLICSHNFLVFPLSPLCGLSSVPSLLLWLFCLSWIQNTKCNIIDVRCWVRTFRQVVHLTSFNTPIF